MNLAILHYHLNRGGVTRVIANHLLSLNESLSGEDRCRVAIIYGGRRAGWPDDLTAQLDGLDVTLCAVPELDYDEEGARPQPRILADQVRRHLDKHGFVPEKTLLHVHNHSVGKNCSLPGALAELSAAGFALLLQIHDFAEDFRPRNYEHLTDALGTEDPQKLGKLLYPQEARIGYAVLNRRDHDILLDAGCDDNRLHFLPNPVPELGELPDRNQSRQKLAARFGMAPGRPFVLYPVRGIRRKNVGEVLLWSMLADNETEFGITLAPINPAERSFFNAWKQTAADLQLRCHFETGGKNGLTFHENLSAADRIITTSVAEGFGMVFLESWLAGRSLIGRDLPEITVDFVEAGIGLDALSPRLAVPVDWIGIQAFREAFAHAYGAVQRAFGRNPIGSKETDLAIEHKTTGGLVDFGELNEPLQRLVLEKVHANSAARRVVLQHNPFIAAALSTARDAVTIEQNQRAIRSNFSLTQSGRRLWDVYQSVLSGNSGESRSPIEGSLILDRFLDPARFHLIRG